MHNLIRLAQTGRLVEDDLGEIDGMSDESVREELRKLISEDEAEKRARALLRDFPPGTLADVFQSVTGEDRATGDVIDEIINSAAQQMDMIEFYANIADLAETMFPALASLHLADKGGGRYAPDAPSSFGEEYHSPELQQTRAPMNNLMQAPGSPEIKPLNQRLVPKKPEEYDLKENKMVQPPRYKHPDLFDQDFSLGLVPALPDAMPNFAAMEPGEQVAWRKDLKKNLIESLKYVPMPYVYDLVFQYLDATNAADAEKYYVDGVDSLSRFGFGKPQLVARLTEDMSLEDIYMYWNSIANHRTLPWVNEEFVDKRYSSSERGKTFVDLYKNYKEGIVRAAPTAENPTGEFPHTHNYKPWPDSDWGDYSMEEPEWWPTEFAKH